MAKKQITIFVDDLSGDELDGVATIPFSIDGVSYEIDLGPENAAKLRDALQPFVSAGRRVSSARRTSSSAAGSDSAKIRAWAAQQGVAVPARGRLPKDVIGQYNATR